MDSQTTADRPRNHNTFLRAGAALSGAVLFLTGCHADRDPVDVVRTVAPEKTLSPAEINDYNEDVTREVSESLGSSLGHLPEKALELGRTPDYNYFIYELGDPDIPPGVANENTDDLNTLENGTQKHIAVQHSASSSECMSSGRIDYHIGWSVNPNGSRRLAVMNLISSDPDPGPESELHTRITHWLKVEARNDGGFIINYAAPYKGIPWTENDPYYVAQTNSPGIQTDVDPEVISGLLEHFENEIKTEIAVQDECDTL